MSLRAWTPWIAAALASAAVPGAGCGTRAAWSKDESERIEQIIRPEKFSENLPGVAGTAVYSAASPGASLPEKDYVIDNTRAKPPLNYRSTPTSRSRERTRSATDAAATSARPKH